MNGSVSDPTADPLIAPRISTLSAQLKAGKLTPEDQARSYAGIWPLVPKGLRPFIESPSLEKLAEVLKAHPRLYWHPLVARQMFHLFRLTWDQEEWRRLGWKLQCDEYGRDLPPNEVDEIDLRLRNLVQGHGEALIGGRIKWEKMCGRKRGPKSGSGISNPYPPPIPWDEWENGQRIHPATLERDFCALRLAFEKELKRLKGKATGIASSEQVDIKKRRNRYRRRVLEVIKQSDIEWSGLRYQS